MATSFMRQPALPFDADLAALHRRIVDAAAAEGLVDVWYDEVDAPMGSVLIAVTAKGVVQVGLPHEPSDRMLATIARRVSSRVVRSRARVDEVSEPLLAYLRGRCALPPVPVDWALCSPFAQRVLRATAEIPAGATRTYGDIASSIGAPRSMRAVGQALAHNPVPIVVPCHRVLPTRGGAGAYRGGPELKQQLLAIDAGMAIQPDDVAPPRSDRVAWRGLLAALGEPARARVGAGEVARTDRRASPS